MTREQALEIVKPYIGKFQQYSVVRLDDILMLIGEERTNRLLNDKIRGMGPSEAHGLYYYWNVVDYVQFPDLNVPKSNNNG